MNNVVFRISRQRLFVTLISYLRISQDDTVFCQRDIGERVKMNLLLGYLER